MTSKIAVYPGSFDPLTNGHVDIICRASKIFDELIVAVAENPRKKALFSAKERAKMISSVLAEQGVHIEVQAFSGLLVNYLKKVKAGVVIRGLRAISDFEYEFQMALTNHSLMPEVDTFFLMSNEKFIFLSSGMVKEIAMYGGDVSEYVPNGVLIQLQNRLKKIGAGHLGDAPTLKK